MCITCGCGTDNHHHDHAHTHDHGHHHHGEEPAAKKITVETDILAKNNRLAAGNRALF
jgi:hydrogenase nickel incorporation protein HypB